MEEDFISALLRAGTEAKNKSVEETARDAAQALWAIFSALMDVGFDREEAFTLVSITVSNAN